MEQNKAAKKYEIQGEEYTLASCSPKRLALYCEILGMKDFAEMDDAESKRAIKIRMLNIGLDTAKIEHVLDACLVEPFLGDVSEIDLSIVDGVFNDFFLQRLQN